MTSRQLVDRKLEAEGRCRLCLRTARERPLTRHRIVPGSAGGRYSPANVVPLCRLCHDLVDVGGDKRLYRRALRQVLWPVEIAKARRYVGWDFDRHYPPSPREQILAARMRESVRPSWSGVRTRAGSTPS